MLGYSYLGQAILAELPSLLEASRALFLQLLRAAVAAPGLSAGSLAALDADGALAALSFASGAMAQPSLTSATLVPYSLHDASLEPSDV